MPDYTFAAVIFVAFLVVYGIFAYSTIMRLANCVFTIAVFAVFMIACLWPIYYNTNGDLVAN